MSAYLLMLIVCCTREEPVLTGVPVDPLLQTLPSAENTRQQQTASNLDESPEQYIRPEGVMVDLQYLGGRRFSGSRDVILAQLGTRLDSRTLSETRGEEHTFDHGAIRVLDDTIYMLEVTLPTPLRRHEALAMVGLPTVVDRYTTLSREYRIYHEWGFRRIQMTRESRDNELVTAVVAWQWLPGENQLRR